MKKYGNKILAILLTAVCLIGVLPLSVYAAYETVYVPPLAALTPGARPSISAGGISSSPNHSAYTIPLPLDIANGVQVIFDELITYETVLLLDAQFISINNLSRVSASIYNFTAEELVGGSFLLFGTAINTPLDGTVLVNNIEVDVVEGAQNLAHRERFEQIEVPDSPSSPTDGVHVQSVLDMWANILLLNVTSLTDLYNGLIEPMGLIIGIPLMIALIGKIIFMIGGKKR